MLLLDNKSTNNLIQKIVEIMKTIANIAHTEQSVKQAWALSPFARNIRRFLFDSTNHGTDFQYANCINIE